MEISRGAPTLVGDDFSWFCDELTKERKFQHLGNYSEWIIFYALWVPGGNSFRGHARAAGPRGSLDGDEPRMVNTWAWNVYVCRRVDWKNWRGSNVGTCSWFSYAFVWGEKSCSLSLSHSIHRGRDSPSLNASVCNYGKDTWTRISLGHWVVKS